MLVSNASHMPPLPGKCSGHVLLGGGHGEDTGHAGGTMSNQLACECLRIPSEGIEEVSGEESV